MNSAKREAGRLGGLATKEKYGVAFFKINGHKGGRPHSLTLTELLRQQQPQIEDKGGMDTPGASNSLSKLKRLYKERLRQKSTGNNEIKETEVTSGSLPEQPLSERSVKVET